MMLSPAPSTRRADTVTPVPLSASARFGELLAFEAIATFATAVPLACGVNVTLTAQVAPGASVVTQFVVRAKDAAAVPASVTDEIVRFARPLLLTVIVF